MSEQKRPRNERFVSPKGRFIYPWLSTPDTKFDDAGVYRVKLAVPVTDASELVEMLEEKYDTNLSSNEAKVRKEGHRPFELSEQETEYLFTFKMKATVTTKSGDSWTQRPAVFDASGQPCPDVRVGGGTVGRISFEVIPYANKMIGAGITLRLKAVQVIELVEYGQADADSFGFAEEEGYSSTTTEGVEEAAEGSEESFDF